MNALRILVVLLAAVLALVSAESGSILVRNGGGFVAVFNVDYDLNGEHKSESSGDFSLGVNKEIKIPEGATNISVKVEEYWFIGSKTTIFTKSYSSPEKKCFKIWGTTLNPSYAEENC